MSGVEKLHSRKHKNIKKDYLQLALALSTKRFRLNFTLNQSSENAKQHSYIIYFENSLLYSQILLSFYTKKITVYAQREPAFSVGQFLILHVKSMFGKYRRGVAAHSTTSRGLTPAVVPTEIAGGHLLSKRPKERYSPPWNIKFQYVFRGVTASH